MIIIDTNVISELMRPEPNARVQEWLTEHVSDIRISVVTAQELAFGTHRMPIGARRARVENAIDQFTREFDTRFLPLTADAARMSGVVLAERMSQGRPTSTSDAQIAGTALVYGAALATRNGADFDGLGIELIDPWEDAYDEVHG